MNKEEIKEILNRLDYNEWEVDLYKVPITWCELYDIRDYITNLQVEINKLTSESTEWENRTYYWQDKAEVLQEENKRLNLELSGYRQAILIDDNLLGLKTRIDKAIEYIKNETKDMPLNGCKQRLNKVLNILKGEK